MAEEVPPCAICRDARAMGEMTVGVTKAAVCAPCAAKLEALPPVYVCGLMSMGAAPEWMELSAARREAIDRAVQIGNDTNKVLHALADPRFGNDHPSMKVGLELITKLYEAGGYRAKVDPKKQIGTETTFQMVTIVLVENCAGGRMDTKFALTILRVFYPHFAINESTFSNAVVAWSAGVGAGGKWPVLAELVGWTGDEETLRVRFAQWKQTDLGSAIWGTIPRG